MTTLTRLFPVIGRVLLSLIFVAIGVGKFYGWTGFEQYMAAKHLIAIPVLLTLSMAVEIAGGMAVLVGWRARSSALLLMAYLVPVTVVFHNFWDLQDAQKQIELVNFLKNVAIMGGLLLIVAFGPGPFSVDSWMRRRRRDAPSAGQAASPAPAPKKS